MEEKIKVQMTAEELYDFTLFHTYSKFAGFLTNILGAAIIFMGIIMAVMGKISPLRLVVFVLAGIIFLAYTPVMLRLRAKKYVQTIPEYKETVTYTFAEDGITQVYGDKEQTYAWKDIQKVIPTPKTFGFYYGADQAMIIPKKDFGDRFQSVMQIVTTHVPRQNIKIR